MRKVLFLDIDGVLNGHDWDIGAMSNTIRRSCVDQLNRVIAATKCEVVLLSAWRYMIHGGAMTVRGFEYLMRTHGVAGLVIAGFTRADWDIDDRTERARQVSEWLADNGPVGRYVVVDDKDFGFEAGGHPLVRTDGRTGLTSGDADRVIARLNR